MAEVAMKYFVYIRAFTERSSCHKNVTFALTFTVCVAENAYPLRELDHPDRLSGGQIRYPGRQWAFKTRITFAIGGSYVKYFQTGISPAAR
ncbi:hypothetical protein [Erwinia sp.]|uniref:hypothetical protein n=1 Tax=Erwinia citreus TaxID=558 RepID=UPI003C76C25C